MSEARWTPEEFARLMSLPEDHPERVAARSHPEFEALVCMQASFESPGRDVVPEADLASARAELSARLERALGRPLASGAASESPTEIRVPSSSPVRAGLLERMLAALSRPPLRAAFALGVLAIVASAGWWAFGPRTREAELRGSDHPQSAMALRAPDWNEADATLSWDAVEGADLYRVYFYSAQLSQVAMRDSVLATSLRLAEESPAGLEHGAKVEVEIVAMRGGDFYVRSKLATVTIP